MLNTITLPITRYLVIGSYPLNIRFSKDIDVICYQKDIQVEYELIGENTAHFKHEGKMIECFLADHQESFQVFLNDFKETTLELLYIIKAGHITFPHREWGKHIMDYHILRKMVDIDNPGIKNYVELHKTTSQLLNSRIKSPSLKNVSKKDFFDDAVEKYFDHDFIHECMAHKEKPMYSYMQPDPDSVFCDKNIWETFSEKEKIQCVLEESYVIALERRIIPFIKRNEKPTHFMEAFKWALMRVCTTLTSGWFRRFAIDNYYTIFNFIDIEYVQKFINQEHKYIEYQERQLEKTT